MESRLHYVFMKCIVYGEHNPISVNTWNQKETDKQIYCLEHNLNIKGGLYLCSSIQVGSYH